MRARELLDRNGLAQSKAPGFISRVTLVSNHRPNEDNLVGDLGE